MKWTQYPHHIIKTRFNYEHQKWTFMRENTEYYCETTVIVKKVLLNFSSPNSHFAKHFIEVLRPRLLKTWQHSCTVKACPVDIMKVKATLSDGNNVTKKWEQPCQSNLPEILEAVRHVKQSVNDYLTHLISSEKDSDLKKPTKASEHLDEDEDKDIEGDSISEFLKEIITLREKHSRSEKRKSNCSNQTKKIRK